MKAGFRLECLPWPLPSNSIDMGLWKEKYKHWVAYAHHWHLHAFALSHSWYQRRPPLSLQLPMALPPCGATLTLTSVTFEVVRRVLLQGSQGACKFGCTMTLWYSMNLDCPSWPFDPSTLQAVVTKRYKKPTFLSSRPVSARAMHPRSLKRSLSDYRPLTSTLNSWRSWVLDAVPTVPCVVTVVTLDLSRTSFGHMFCQEKQGLMFKVQPK